MPKSVHDYVPLYFGFKTPMVACLQNMNESIVFLRFSLDILEIKGTIISNGNARSDNTLFRAFNTLNDLDFLDVKGIQSVKWAGDNEAKRMKQAEILITDSLPISMLLDVICYSENARQKVLDQAKQRGIYVQVKINQGWFFTKGITT